MELINYFDKFLADTVNLNKSRIDKLNEKEIVLRDFIKASDVFKNLYKDMQQQGSLSQKTIIKPATDKKEFDADLALMLEKNPKWEPKDYLIELHKIFKDDGNYKDIVSLGTRNVKINYSGDFHVDIIPCLENPPQFLICNRGSNQFENDNPIGFKNWLFEKNGYSKGHLIKTIRLFKYLRDIKTNFTVKSILLNTLLGERIIFNDNIADFKNLPTTLLTLFKRLNLFLQNNSTMPVILNPVLKTEDLTIRNWDKDKYSNFRDKIKMYCEKVEDAYNETDKEKSIEKWKLVFGDEFPSKVEQPKADQAIAANTNSRPWCY